MNGSEKSALSDIYLRALNLLTRRDHTTVELQRKLMLRGFPAESVNDLLEQLTGKGYLDDRRFAERWADAAIRNGRGYGLRILQELQKRGISREIAAEAFAHAAVEYPEHDSLAAIVSKRFSAFDPARAPQKEKQRVYAYLQRRGFSIRAITGFFNTREEEFD